MNDALHNADTESASSLLEIAQTILDGFDKHYHLFREFSDEAMSCFAQTDWARGGKAGKERILGYEARVIETVDRLNTNFPGAAENTQWWPGVKSAYITLLMNHLQSECAETFYNSVACRVLHRNYFNNENR